MLCKSGRHNLARPSSSFRFVLTPLEKWAEEHSVDSKSLTLVLLLDALDEADHDNQGCVPVLYFIAKEFLALPSFVKVVLTSRPATPSSVLLTHIFRAWSPHWIEPEASDNLEDMRKILNAQVAACKCIPSDNSEGAVDVLLRKSKGQLIYANYAVQYLSFKDGWKAAEIEQALPEGLGGAYTLMLKVVTRAVLMDGGKPMLKLLLNKVGVSIRS